MKTDTQFLADLESSRDHVWRFASIQKAAGVDIVINPATTRPDAAVRGDYADDGDMELRIRVEHKVRNIDFTSREDFPYPTLIVAEVYSIERQKGKPFVYVIESRSGSHAAVVYSRSMHKWSKVRRWDAAQGRECEFYEAPLEVVRFRPLGEVFR